MQNEANESPITQGNILSEETVPAEAVTGKVYNTDLTDVDLESYSEEVLCGKQKSLRGLTLAVLLLAAGIVAVLIFWLIRYKDLFL